MFVYLSGGLCEHAVYSVFIRAFPLVLETPVPQVPWICITMGIYLISFEFHRVSFCLF